MKKSYYKKNNGNYEEKKTPAEWCKSIGLKVISYEGQFDIHSYCSVNLSLEEFLNRIANCKLEKPENYSRFEIKKFKKKLIKKLDK